MWDEVESLLPDAPCCPKWRKNKLRNFKRKTYEDAAANKLLVLALLRR